MDQDLKKVYIEIIEVIYKNDSIIAKQILDNSSIDGYLSVHKAIDVRTTKPYVKSLLVANITTFIKLFERFTKLPISEIWFDGKPMVVNYVAPLIDEEPSVRSKAPSIIEEPKDISKTVEQTFEQTFDEELFIKSDQNSSTKEKIVLSFYNESSSTQLNFEYIKGDITYTSKIFWGYMIFPIVFVSIPLLVIGYSKKKRIVKLLKDIKSVITVGFRPSNDLTKKFLSKINVN